MRSVTEQETLKPGEMQRSDSEAMARVWSFSWLHGFLLNQGPPG
jgi:hypothetical protein